MKSHHITIHHAHTFKIWHTDIPARMQTCKRTFVQSYMHTCLHDRIHTLPAYIAYTYCTAWKQQSYARTMHTYTHTCAYMHVSIRKCAHTNKFAYMTHVHAYIHECIHTYIALNYIHALQKYMRIHYMHACMRAFQACIHACMHHHHMGPLHTCIHAYMHAYVHSKHVAHYIHARVTSHYMHTCFHCIHA